MRTTAAAVAAVLVDASASANGQGDYDGSTDLTPYMETATAIVDRVYTCSVNKGKALSTIELELIERWLSAHFYCASDQPFSSKSVAGRSGSYQGQTGMGLTGTKYGQVALNVDWSGCLSNLDKRQVASASWLGKPPSEQTPYDQRD